MPKINDIIHGCTSCPHKTYWANGRYRCSQVSLAIPDDLRLPVWCPLPDHPAKLIESLQKELDGRDWKQINYDLPPNDGDYVVFLQYTDPLTREDMHIQQILPYESKQNSFVGEFAPAVTHWRVMSPSPQVKEKI